MKTIQTSKQSDRKFKLISGAIICTDALDRSKFISTFNKQNNFITNEVKFGESKCLVKDLDGMEHYNVEDMLEEMEVKKVEKKHYVEQEDEEEMKMKRSTAAKVHSLQLQKSKSKNKKWKQ